MKANNWVLIECSSTNIVTNDIFFKDKCTAKRVFIRKQGLIMSQQIIVSDSQKHNIMLK